MRIGDTVNPGLLNYDPSQFVQQSGISSALLSQAMTMAGDKIDGILEKRKEDKENVKSGKELAKAMQSLYPEMSGPLEPYLFALDDENVPLNERGRLGADISKFINMGVEKQRSDALAGLELQRIGLQREGLQLDRDRLGLDRDQATSKAQFENDKLLSEAMGIRAGVADAVGASKGKAKLPEQSLSMLDEAIQTGNGPAALSAAKAAQETIQPFTGPANLKMEEIPIQLPDGSSGIQQVWSDGSGQLWDLDGQALGDGVLPPPPGVGSITPPMTLPRGVRPVAPAQTPAEAKKEQLEIQKLQGDVDTRKAEVAKQDDAKATAKASAEDTLALIDKLKKHAGFKDLFGVSVVPDWMPATDKKGARAIKDQLGGQTFATIIQQMRGLGAMSDAEGKAMRQAAARLDEGQSEKDVLDALNDLEAQVKEKLGRLGGTTTPQASPEKSAADRLKALRGGQ